MNKFCVILLLLLLSVQSIGQERKFLLWNKNQVEIEPVKDIFLQVNQKFHYLPESCEVDLKYSEIFVGHDIAEWIEYGAGFRCSSKNITDGDWLKENRPMLFVSLSKVIKELEFKFQNRFELRTYKEQDDYFRHKQQFAIEFPGFTDWGMQFYLAEESYFKMNGDGTHLARFYSGIKALDKKHFDMKFYYSLEKAKKDTSWITSDIIGLNLSFSI